MLCRIAIGLRAAAQSEKHERIDQIERADGQAAIEVSRRDVGPRDHP